MLLCQDYKPNAEDTDGTGDISTLNVFSAADPLKGLDHWRIHVEEVPDQINKVLVSDQDWMGFILEFWSIIRRN